jgi:hypothetical protein
MRFKAFTGVNINDILDYDIVYLAGRYQHFRGTYSPIFRACLYSKYERDAGIMFF